MIRKPLLLLTLLILVALVFSTAAAQDVVPDQPVGEEIDLSQEMTPDGLNTVREFPVTRDTYIASNQPNTNFGGETVMRLGYSLGGVNLGAMRLLLHFDLSSIPRGANINRATLRIYLSGSSPGGDSSMGYEARFLNSSWNERSVTWAQHQPSWGSVIGQGSASATPGWHEANVLPLVREWIDNGRTNHGLTVIGDERIQERQRIYFTKEANNGLHARLIVDFTQSVDRTPPVASVRSLPEWSPANFTVRWEGSDPTNPDGTPGSGIRHYDVWYSRDGGGSWIDWRAQVTSTSTTFEGGKHLQTYDFTARAVDNAGNVQSRSGSQARTRVDAEPPFATMNPLPEYTTSSSFTISWFGNDSGSGLANYDVQWRQVGGPWTTLYENTTLTSFVATGAQEGVTYEFRARGTDRVGNAQPWPDIPQTRTTIALRPVSTITGFNPPFLQIKEGPGPNDSFQVFWQAQTAPGTAIASFDIYFRRPDSSNWLVWQQNTQQTNGTFVLAPGDPDGIYQFEVTARNSLGQQEEVTGQPDGQIMVDRLEPFIEPRSYQPVLVWPRE